MRYAIIQTGGKQYRAVEGEAIEVEKLDAEVGKKVELADVMLVADGDTVMVGTPTVADAKVAATVLAQDKGEKITVFKYKPKIRYRVKTGHRQRLTRLQVDSIQTKGRGEEGAEGGSRAGAGESCCGATDRNHRGCQAKGKGSESQGASEKTG